MKKSSLDLNLSVKRTRNREFLFEIDRVVIWAALVELIAPYYPDGENGRQSFVFDTMLRVHLLSSNGSPCQTPPSKRPFSMFPCTASLPT